MARPGRPKQPEKELHATVWRFLEYISSELNRAKNTVMAYKRDLADVSEWLRERNIKLPTASTADLTTYISDLSSQPGKGTKGNSNKASKRTIMRRLSALRQYYQFIIEEGMRDDDPTSTIESPKQERTLPKVLSEKEINNLIETSHEKKGPDGKRLVCLMELLYSTGMRVSELVSMPVAAISNDMRSIVVSGKGDKERITPVSEPARRALKAYLDARDTFILPGREDKQKPWLFPSRSSQTGHLTRQRFAQILNELAEASNVDKSKVSPHVLRHAFATHMLKRGADLRTVQKKLGHADIATTQIYTRVVEDQMEKTVQDHHPLANKQKASNE